MTEHTQYYAAWTDLDLDAEGRAEGSVFVSVSTNASAYRALRVPIVVLRNGEGPGCLVTGGAHGDEWEGQIATARLARETRVADIRGTLVIMPHFNMAACEAGTRVSPLDGGNLNLTWPADPGAGPTGQIAQFVEAQLLPRMSHWIDLHTGGRTLIYAPRPAIHLSPSRELNRRALDALVAFGAAENLVFEVQETRSASAAAQRHGVVYVYGEFGGGGLVSRRGLEIALRGTTNVLRHAGVLAGAVPAVGDQRCHVMSGETYRETRALYWFAERRGCFELLVGLSDEVEAGQTVGLVHPLDGSLSEPRKVVAGAPGTVVCLRAQPLVENGDCLGHLGRATALTAIRSIWG